MLSQREMAGSHGRSVLSALHNASQHYQSRSENKYKTTCSWKCWKRSYYHKNPHLQNMPVFLKDLFFSFIFQKSVAVNSLKSVSGV